MHTAKHTHTHTHRTPDLVEIEAQEKEQAGCLLFVIDPQTRALASLVEASEYICRGRNVVLCVLDVVEGTSFGTFGRSIDADELKDLNRARNYLRDVALRHGVKVSSNVRNAITAVIESHQRSETLKLAGTPPDG